MGSAERSPGQEKPRLRERLAQISYLDQYRPTVKVTSVTEVEFEKFKEKGVNTLLLDVEGTLVSQNGWDLDPEIVQHIKSQEFDNIALITNNKPKDEMGFVKLNWWAEQIGASVVFTPLDRSERKPGSKMLLKAMRHFGIKAQQALVIGDKVTADILAANRTGMWSAWVNRLGYEDLPGDRFARRPLEAGIRKITRPNQNIDDITSPMESQSAEMLANENTLDLEYSQTVKPASLKDVPQELWDKSRIIGLGQPNVLLPQQVLDSIPPGLSERPGIKQIKDILNLIDTKYGKQFDDFMGNNGRKIANSSTALRIPGALIVAGLLIADKPKLARIAHALFASTDLIDGWAARKDYDQSEEARSKGGKFDQTIDKIAGFIIEVALAKKDRLPIGNTLTIIGRDQYMNRVVRPRNIEKGLDTSSVLAGKMSTLLVELMHNFSMTDKPSVANRVFREIATSAKVASVSLSENAWVLKEEQKRRFVEVREQMLQAD